jgi:4-hydroxy-tetrahydrodipicolinate synthase
VEIVIDQCDGRVPVITGANNPFEAFEYVHCAQMLGADAILWLAGYYNKSSQEGLYQHFKYLHD